MTLELAGVARQVGGKVHIHPTDLVLQKGSMNVLLGPTLAGKTSLMRLMAGLDRPDQGRILWEGRDVTGIRVQDRGVAMVYQQFINYPGMTVFENIASPLRLQRRPRPEIKAEVGKVAEMMRLTPFLDRKPLELSGGQQQRCALARALVKGAGLVLLDEPLANLDYKLREELRIEIPRIFEESGAIFVYATTEPEEALLLGGHTATLWEGRITQFGPTPDVYRRPVDATTARVFSDPPMNFLTVEKRGGGLAFGAALAALPEGAVGTYLAGLEEGSYQAGFRPDRLRLVRDNMPVLSGHVRLDCKVIETEITGSETFIHATFAKARFISVVEGVHNLPPGAETSFDLDLAHVYLFDARGRLAADSGPPMVA